MPRQGSVMTNHRGDSAPMEGSPSTAPLRGDSKEHYTKLTPDQLYLMDKINTFTERGRLTIPAVQRLNSQYGTRLVVSSMRTLRVSAEEHVLGVKSAYAYLNEMCKAFT